MLELTALSSLKRLFASAFRAKYGNLRKASMVSNNSPRNFFLHTKGKLENLGFAQSDADPCLLISEAVICLIYVDDELFFYKDAAVIDRLTQAMKKDNILFREEDSVDGYLGVLIWHKRDLPNELSKHSISMTQCPVVCVSKQQSTIATSTIKSEYTALLFHYLLSCPLLQMECIFTNKNS